MTISLVFCFTAVIILAACIASIIFAYRKLNKQYINLQMSYQNLEKLNNTLRSQRHDYLNHLQVVYGLMQLEEYDELEKYLEPVFKDMMKTGKALKTSKPSINALLKAKMEEAQRQDVDFYVEVKSDLKGLQIEDWELCKVLSNLIDNALTAATTDSRVTAEERDEKSVRLEIMEDRENYIFSVFKPATEDTFATEKLTFEITTETDMDKDHLCDICGVELSKCADTDNNHKCDICGKTFSKCADDNKDHNCDICGTELSKCDDKDNNHLCDICSAALSSCDDADNDHACDICGMTLTVCVDDVTDHKCDICGAEFTNLHTDDNKDHLCDEAACGKVLSECTDENKDHNCDICGTGVSNCTDKDKDHNCDLCGDKMTDCDDKPDAETNLMDHKCDICEEVLSQCEDQILVSGMDGMVNVQNISDEDITGEIYVYYKYAIVIRPNGEFERFELLGEEDGFSYLGYAIFITFLFLSISSTLKLLTFI